MPNFTIQVPDGRWFTVQANNQADAMTGVQQVYQQQTPGTGEDMARGGASGAIQGAVGLANMGGDAPDVVQGLAQKALGFFGDPNAARHAQMAGDVTAGLANTAGSLFMPSPNPATLHAQTQAASRLMQGDFGGAAQAIMQRGPTTEQITQHIPFGNYTPHTGWGRTAKSLGGAIPAVVGGPEGLAARAAVAGAGALGGSALREGAIASGNPQLAQAGDVAGNLAAAVLAHRAVPTGAFGGDAAAAREAPAASLLDPGHVASIQAIGDIENAAGNAVTRNAAVQQAASRGLVPPAAANAYSQLQAKAMATPLGREAMQSGLGGQLPPSTDPFATGASRFNPKFPAAAGGGGGGGHGTGWMSWAIPAMALGGELMDAHKGLLLAAPAVAAKGGQMLYKHLNNVAQGGVGASLASSPSTWTPRLTAIQAMAARDAQLRRGLMARAVMGGVAPARPQGAPLNAQGLPAY